MNTHFEEHVLYHDAIDRREAKERAQQAEPEEEPELCCCLDPVHPGDDDDCPLHGLAAQECTCGPNPDAPACLSCKARGEFEELPF